MDTITVIKLEDLVAGQNLIIFKALLLAALLDPSEDLRNKVISHINKKDDRFLRKLYAVDDQIYAGFRDCFGGLNTVYVADVPKIYIPGQPTMIHPFDLDFN
ncbi:MAG TPA: hypothetical protein VJH68_05800 [Candidatus Nanoarchaeia archaeon]|nr:hypothetical protein [Candidatus Nanoarchaeia archaeon]